MTKIFQKYLAGRKWQVVDYFNPWKDPEDAIITGGIKKCLAIPAVNN